MGINHEEITVFIEICRDGAQIPEYKNKWDAGMDVCSADEIYLKPGETKIISTGLKLAIPEGFEIQVRPRSGISFNTPLRISNSPGTIDTGYRDELGIIISNISSADSKNQSDEVFTVSSKGNKNGTYIIGKGDRIAQIVLAEVPRIKFSVVDCVKEIGEDRMGGFGSTGV